MQPLKVTIVPVTPFAQNCSIVACTATNRAAIVDPGGDPHGAPSFGLIVAPP